MNMMARLLIVSALFVGWLGAQDAESLLFDVQQQVLLSLNEQPNHACRMLVRRARFAEKARARILKRADRDLNLARRDRLNRFSASLPPDVADTVELEVAVVQGRELYAFPGSPRFEERPLAELVGFGAISTGDFNAHARSLFADSIGRPDFAGEVELEGRRALSWDYQVRLADSGYSINIAGVSARVAYRGSFWADAESHDLLRLTIEAEDIPIEVGVDEALTQIDYRRVALKHSSFLAPHTARLSLMSSSGEETLNETQFVECKEFGAESTLSFDDRSETFYVERIESFDTFEIPAGTRLPTRLRSPIDSKQSRVGSAVQVELTSDVKLPGGDRIPKGATLTGRIRRLERYTDGVERTVVGLELTELTFGRRRAPLFLELQQVLSNQTAVQHNGPSESVSRGLIRGASASDTVMVKLIESYPEQDAPGIGLFYVLRREFVVQPGMRMVWRVGRL